MSDDVTSIREPGFTRTPNGLLEILLPILGEAELKVALFISRKTHGWHKKDDDLSLSQFEEGTGLSRPSVIAGITNLVNRGLLVKTSRGNNRPCNYRLIIPTSKEALPDSNSEDTQLVKQVNLTSKEALPQLVKQVNTQKKVKKLDKRKEEMAADAALTPTLPRKEQDESVSGEWDAIQAVPEDIRRRPERVTPGSARDLDLALEFVCFDTQDSRETLALHRSWIAKERNALREINKHLEQPITGQEVRDKFKRGGIWYATWMAEDGRKPNPAEVTKYVRRLENEVKSAARLQREAQSTARTVVYPTIEPPAPISEDERRENLYILSRRPFAAKAASA